MALNLHLRVSAVRMPKELVKIQRPLATTEDVNMTLIYNENRSIEFTHRFTDGEMVALFRLGEAKVYFNADFDGQSFSFNERAEEQSW